ncbi:MAG: nuclear transport factor 2 family protein [Acidobacteria bacterium]|nr:nuclear transport factor 2 family protein [Acidobacteriota bacterium]
MTEHVALVWRLIECYGRLDAAGFEAVLHLDARYSAPGSDYARDVVGRYEIIEHFRRSVFPGWTRVQLEPVHIWEDASQAAVIVEWRSRVWTNDGLLHLKSGVYLIEVRDGLIYGFREYVHAERVRDEALERT